MRFTVATFNIHHGRGTDGILDLTRTAAAIEATGADLVALQELDRGLARTGRIDQPRALEELTGLKVHFFPTLKRGGGDYGIALAAREALDAEYRQLPGLSAEEPRGVVVTRWRDITVVGTHIAQPRGPRRRQIPALAEMVGLLERPVLVMGDLNSTRWTLGTLRKAGLRPTRRWQRTIVRRPLSEVDHILVTEELTIERAWSLPLAVSDHRPLAALISIALPPSA